MVSVIITTYNSVEKLIMALYSVLNQTWQDMEVLVCDDGSTDETGKKIKEISYADDRIHYIGVEHSGRTSALKNIGIKNAKGEWLAFLNDDDIWNPTKLEAQIHVLEKSGLRACCTNAFLYRKGENSGKRCFSGDEDVSYSYKDLIRNNPVIYSSMMVRRDIIMECDGFSEANELIELEDYALWCRIIGYTNIYYISKPLIGYIVKDLGSIWNKEMKVSTKQKKLVKNYLEKWIEGKDERIREKYKKEKVKITDYFGIFKRLLKGLKRK